MTRTLQSTPAADGFRMPGEFESHAGCWMLWPERPDNWREAARPAQTAFAAGGGGDRPVRAGHRGGLAHSTTPPRCALLPADVRVVEMSHDDCWMRDVGPTFVVNRRGTVRGVDWHFNAWGGLHGGLYFPWDQDELVARKVLEIEGLARYRAPIVNEGGAIHVDGEGTALVTEECLLNPNRNPSLTRASDRGHSCATTSASTQVIWLGTGVFNDETDGHIDNLACFVRPGEVCLTWTDRTPRSAARDVARCLGAAQGRARRARPAPQGDHACRCRARCFCASARRAASCRVEGTQGAPGGRAPGRQLRQLLHRQPRHRDAAARCTHRPPGRAASQAPVSRPARGGRAGARNSPRRRQYPLHHAAGPRRNANPVTVCVVSGGQGVPLAVSSRHALVCAPRAVAGRHAGDGIDRARAPGAGRAHGRARAARRDRTLYRQVAPVGVARWRHAGAPGRPGAARRGERARLAPHRLGHPAAARAAAARAGFREADAGAAAGRPRRRIRRDRPAALPAGRAG